MLELYGNGSKLIYLQLHIFCILHVLFLYKITDVFVYFRV